MRNFSTLTSNDKNKNKILIHAHMLRLTSRGRAALLHNRHDRYRGWNITVNRKQRESNALAHIMRQTRKASENSLQCSHCCVFGAMRLRDWERERVSLLNVTVFAPLKFRARCSVCFLVARACSPIRFGVGLFCTRLVLMWCDVVAHTHTNTRQYLESAYHTHTHTAWQYERYRLLRQRYDQKEKHRSQCLAYFCLEHNAYVEPSDSNVLIVDEYLSTESKGWFRNPVFFSLV